MSVMKSTIMDIEEQLMKGRTKIDMEWISVELNVPLEFVEDVLAQLEQEEQYDAEFEFEAMGFQQEIDAMMS